MPRTEQGVNDRSDRPLDQSPDGQTQAQAQENARQSDAVARERGGFSEWFASTIVRTGIALIGFVLLLFALGQAVGFDLLGLFADAVTSQTGRWLVVALFALLLIVAAHRGLRWNRQRV